MRHCQILWKVYRILHKKLIFSLFKDIFHGNFSVHEIVQSVASKKSLVKIKSDMSKCIVLPLIEVSY